jgi:hypothetical protein
LFVSHVNRLRKEDSQFACCEWLSIKTPPDISSWQDLKLPNLFRGLIATGLSMDRESEERQNALATCLCSNSYNERCLNSYNERGGKSIAVDLLSALIEAGVGISDEDQVGNTHSMHARHRGLWRVWCEALKCNSKHIEDV